MNDPIIKTLTLTCAPARAFEIFVHRIASWWPLDGHVVSAAAGKAALAVTIEPQVGGAVYETMHDGNRTDWGKVLVFEEGRHLAMTWHPGNNADHPTQVDVTFYPTDTGGTVVTLTHSGWEIWAEDAQAKRDNYDSGWDFVLETCFVPETQS